MSRKFFCLQLLSSALAVPACLHAQSAPQHTPVPNFELYGGYSYVFRTTNPTSTTVATDGQYGWDASLKIPLLGSFLGIKGDVSGGYLDGTSNPDFNPKAYYFLLGPQVGVHLGRSTVFVHGLVGSAHLTQDVIPPLKSNNAFAVAVGGGLDAGFSRNLAWRVTGDFYNTNYKSTSKNVKEILNSNGRIATGPVFRF
jgi:opacity protein-like surface antigen